MQQKILIGLILTLIIVVFIPVYWAMEPGRQEAASLRQQTEAAERGAKLYSSVCATCHGTQGEGIVGPALKGTQLNENTLQKFIVRGIPGTAMPAWGKEDGGPFHRQQITDLVTFIKNWDSVLLAKPGAVKKGEAPTITAAEPGKAVFELKCQGCHTIGGGRKIGPDLKKVTELRDNDWLIQFIIAPDKVIAQGDTIAQQLVKEYGVPMPNLGLSETEAKEVLSYIKAQSASDGQ